MKQASNNLERGRGFSRMFKAPLGMPPGLAQKKGFSLCHVGMFGLDALVKKRRVFVVPRVFAFRGGDDDAFRFTVPPILSGSHIYIVHCKCRSATSIILCDGHTYVPGT